ncbi:Class 3 lipase [uncultured virus]|nr:Class 3 lipase [uncultured virus]
MQTAESDNFSKTLNYGQTLFQDACLINLVVNSILTGDQHGAYVFDWNIIGAHGTQFHPDYNYEDARLLLQLSLMVTNANYREISLGAPEWLIDTPLSYSTCPVINIITNSNKTGSKYQMVLAHVLYNERANVAFIVFSGTVDACMVGIDLAYRQDEITGILNYFPGMKAHKGIHAAYLSIREQLIQTILPYINRKAQLIITGHSLGAALSNFCALDLAYYNPLHYSFASPLVFNPATAENFERLVKWSYRVANLSDLVTLAPLPIMPNKDTFCHVGKMIMFQNNLGDYRENHALSYMKMYNIPYVELPK